MMDSAKIIRPLGQIEKYSTTRHVMGHYQCVGNTCKYVVSSPKLSLTASEIVETALARTVLALPMLQVAIGEEDSPKPYYAQLPSIDLATHLDWHKLDLSESDYEAHLLRSIEEQHQISWPDVETQSPWKLIVFENTRQSGDDVVLDMMFAVHHALSDGKSTFTFHRQLLESLNDSSTQPEIQDQVLRFSEPPVLVPSQEELVNFRLSWRFFLNTLWEEFGPQWLQTKRPTPWTAGPHKEEKSVHIRLLQLPHDRVMKLRRISRSKNSGLMPLLHSLVALSLSRRLPQAHPLQSITVFSLRPYVDTTKLDPATDLSRAMTDLVTIATHYHSQETAMELRSSEASTIPDTIWDVAAKIHGEVREKARTLPNDDIMGLLSFVDWRQRATKLLGGPRSDTWELSNPGFLNGKVDGGSWKIQRSVFTQSAHTLGAPFCVNTASIEDGMLAITLTWQDGTIETELMEGIYNDLDTWLAFL